jgi:hypothetical protein
MNDAVTYFVDGCYFVLVASIAWIILANARDKNKELSHHINMCFGAVDARFKATDEFMNIVAIELSKTNPNIQILYNAIQEAHEKYKKEKACLEECLNKP